MSRAVAFWCKVKIMLAGPSSTRTQSPACTLHRLHATLACASHCTALASQWKTRPLSITWRFDSQLQKGWVSKSIRDSHPKHCHTLSSCSNSSWFINTRLPRCTHHLPSVMGVPETSSLSMFCKGFVSLSKDTGLRERRWVQEFLWLVVCVADHHALLHLMQCGLHHGIQWSTVPFSATRFYKS